MRLRLLLIGIAVLAGLGVGMPFCGTETEAADDKCIRALSEETVDAGLEGWSWWPIGTRCYRVDADGSRHEKVVPPWRGS